MKIATIIIRSFLGLAFVVFGLNGFFHFIPGSTQVPPGLAGEFMVSLMKSGYFLPIAGLQFLGGALLLSGRFSPLGLTLLGPIIVNIVLFHLFLLPEGLPIAGVTAALALFLLFAYRDRFAGLLKA
jgi:putative oxidoreductase